MKTITLLQAINSLFRVINALLIFEIVSRDRVERIITPTNVMLNDAVFLLHEQLDEPRNYVAVLEAIAAGYHALTDIATMAGINRSNISKYLDVLQELGYVAQSEKGGNCSSCFSNNPGSNRNGYAEMATI